MFAIVGAMGQTGSVVSETLLAAGHAVRMIVRRDDAQADGWRKKGAHICVADLDDHQAMVRAFGGAHGAYVMGPPHYLASDMFAQARLTHASLIAAANAAGLPRMVALSSVGAQHAGGTGNIGTTHDLECQLRGFDGVRTVLRAANFMENWAWSLSPVLEQSILPSMFLPPERALPMVSVKDIGRTAAHLLLEQSATHRLVELHGPCDVSPADAAAALGRLLDRTVTAVGVARERWAGMFAEKGFPALTADAFCDMFDGFNSGHIAFDGTGETLRGVVGLDAALAACLAPRIG
ncbi:NmrA family NAD(P)-binding protein [Massilia antarctica]|uniref:NmrA family NAD(P)-binding protein n=1 Tax=Massilia antarctica TaxID=2765360 RepID=UPI0006BB7E70|nr:NmrA family NAD(P)-binding protein [Massilia sp. H27-R4]MCY0913839.1 NmrA family NAD(P)-binding protein [Massilia sp. H27-R4]CUI04432.1 Putative nucleoside-diphosphate-sugar epimerase [Janthinobacterium sp. CG23_2]CUU28218.1 Putative nucleoside-diphosphate-sugar epimerase [Janthinobacterium sp. CG23_2]